MKINLNEALQLGINAHKAGKFHEADRYYTAILKEQPNHPDANHNLGILAIGLGKLQEALPFLKKAISINPSIDQYWVSYIDILIRLKKIDEAKTCFKNLKVRGADKNILNQIMLMLYPQDEAIQEDTKTEEINPPAQQIQKLVDNLNKGNLKWTLYQLKALSKQYPQSAILYNLLGATNAGLKNFSGAIESYKKALKIQPAFCAALNNLGVALELTNQIDQAIKIFKKALEIDPDSVEALINLGNTLKINEKFQEAVDAFDKAIEIRPDCAEAYNNLGSALQVMGDLKKSIEAFQKAIEIKPNYPEPYKNLGVSLQLEGHFSEAVAALDKAIEIKPDYGEAHRILSFYKKYEKNDYQIPLVEKLIQAKTTSINEQCHLSFTLAKINEDLGNYSDAFSHLNRGNTLRKKILDYSIQQDKKLFSLLKNNQNALKEFSLNRNKTDSKLTPIFILGLPRSGTTLVEQVISSHSMVTGAGELDYVDRYGRELCTGKMLPNSTSISNFRTKYLAKLAQQAEDKKFVTDKMPHNFLFIPLICAALPEAKIIHVHRDPAATCWSNYKHYFNSSRLGYCYNLQDLASYYELYFDLMSAWTSIYKEKIFNLCYEELTSNQETLTKQLIDYIGLKWQRSCLSPEENDRVVTTASQRQVQEKIYRGSSSSWRKYELLLNGVFDKLPTL